MVVGYSRSRGIVTSRGIFRGEMVRGLVFEVSVPVSNRPLAEMGKDKRKVMIVYVGLKSTTSHIPATRV